MKPKSFEHIVTHPTLWLILYGCGTILTIAAVSGTFGGGAAGTVAGFLTLAGTVGYEAMRTRYDRTKLSEKLTALNKSHDLVARDLARTRSDVELLKDDMALTARSMQQQARKLEESLGARKVQPLVQRAQESLTRMANRPKAATPQPQNFKELQLMAAARLANMNNAGRPPEKAEDTTAPAPKFSEPVIAELLHHAVQHDRVETFAQPIVRLPSRKLAYLELFARIRARAGIYLSADQYRHLAEQETLISEVDHILLMHAIDSIRADARRDAETGYFLNISARTLKNMDFMSDLLGFLKSNRDLAPHLIFELQQKEFDALTPPYIAVMKGLGKVGCVFSLDHVQNTNLDHAKLRDLNVRFLKIEGHRLAQMGNAYDGITLVQNFKQGLASAGVTVIVERLETERDLKELLDFDIDYGEGFLFGKPDLEIAYRPRKTA